MMKIVGITGGIGAGKSTVCAVFESMGIPVFHADDEAKKIYDEEPMVLKSIAELFGNEMMAENKLNRENLATLVFSNSAKLKQLNALIHPFVRERFQRWKSSQKSSYVIREAAILIESASYQDCNHIILVIAEEEIRIKRIMARSGLNETQIKSRIKEQMKDEERKPFCDFEIINNGNQLLLPEIMKIHLAIMA